MRERSPARIKEILEERVSTRRNPLLRVTRQVMQQRVTTAEDIEGTAVETPRLSDSEQPSRAANPSLPETDPADIMQQVDAVQLATRSLRARVIKIGG